MNRDCKFRCKLVGGKYRCRCTRLGCGNRIKDRDNIPKRISAKCKGVYGLGDLVAFVLSSMGVTKDRWARWTGEPSSGCRDRKCSKCQERQAYLNRWSDWFAAKWQRLSSA